MTEASPIHDAAPRNAAAILDSARDSHQGQPLFLVKGGVAMELRTRGSARATKDFDTALRADTADLAEHLDPALRDQNRLPEQARRDRAIRNRQRRGQHG